MLHQELFELVKSLEKIEVENIRKHILAKREHNNYEKLINQLSIADSPPEIKTLIKVIYPGKRFEKCNEAFLKLAQRTKNLILEVIKFDLSKPDLPVLVKPDLAYLELSKKSRMVYFLKLRNPRMKTVFRLMDEIIEDSIIYENYSLALEHLYQKKSLLYSISPNEPRDEISKKISFFEECRKVIDAAKEMSLNYDMDCLEAIDLPFDEYKTRIETDIAWLSEQMQKFKTPLLYYYLLKHHLFLFDLNADLKSYLNVCKELFNLTHEYNSVKMAPRIHAISDNIAYCEMRRGNFNGALRLLLTAENAYLKGSKKDFKNKKLLFLCYFNLGQIENAENILKKISPWKENLDDFSKDLLVYFELLILVEKGEYREANLICAGKLPFQRNNTSWAFWFKITGIFIRLYLGDAKDAVRKTENLRKQIQRVSKSRVYRKRDLQIFKIVDRLSKTEFKITDYPTISRMLNELNEDPSLNWAPLTAELIPFNVLVRLQYPNYFLDRSA